MGLELVCEEALPDVGGGGCGDEGAVSVEADGSGPKWTSEGRPSKSSANACRIFFWRTVRDLNISTGSFYGGLFSGDVPWDLDLPSDH